MRTTGRVIRGGLEATASSFAASKAVLFSESVPAGLAPASWNEKSMMITRSVSDARK